MPTWKVIHQRVEDFLKEDHGLFHALLWDAPYNLESILKRNGKKGSKPPKYQKDGSFARQAAGFMGLTWDSSLCYHAEFWESVTRHLHPGAFSMTFTHPRKDDLLATAQREAGYLMNSTIYNYHSGWNVIPKRLAWTYGSGKPTGTSVDQHVSLGKEAWNGWQYGNPLRPEIEPIIVSQKPYGKGRTADIIGSGGAGALNIKAGKGFKAGGRFPGNLVVTHHPDCIYKGTKTIRNNSGNIDGDEPSETTRNTYGGYPGRTSYQARGEDGYEEIPNYDCHPDCAVLRIVAEFGEVAHYFVQADWSFEIAERLIQANPVFYEAKVGEKERNLGCWNMPLVERQRANPGGLANDPKWANTWQYNNHPTLKPIRLTTYLASLLLPPPEYAPRRLLVLCSGAGSEMAGALLAGWNEVIGVEMHPEDDDSPDYCGMAERRLTEIEKWLKWGHTDIYSIVQAAYGQLELEQKAEQISMFEE